MRIVIFSQEAIMKNEKTSDCLYVNNTEKLYKHIRKNMEREYRHSRRQTFLQNIEPLYCTVFAVVIAVSVAKYCETESISALIVMAVSIVISMIYIFLMDKPS